MFPSVCAMAISTSPVMVFLGPFRMPMWLFRFLIFPDFVWYSGRGTSNLKNCSSSCCHCSRSAVFSMRMSVLTFLWAMRLAATTVFPKEVAAERMPESYFSSSSCAVCCSGRSAPWKSKRRRVPFWRLSLIQ